MASVGARPQACDQAVLRVELQDPLDLRRLLPHRPVHLLQRGREVTRLADEARRREALFEQSVEAEKTRGDALARRFEEALRQAKEEPVTKPLRDFDLD